MRIERNDDQGDWDKEGRIHFYGIEAQLQRNFPDFIMLVVLALAL